MLSVVIPTLNDGKLLGPTLAALIHASMSGVVKQVVIADGGSDDDTETVAEASGCDWLVASRGRGSQLAAGAEIARRGSWLLFLHADTVLAEGWETEIVRFVERAETSGDAAVAAAFRFALDDDGWKARLLERLVALRCVILGLPYGDQGLLISRRLYDDVGGYRDMPLMEDVDIVHRIGRRRLRLLKTAAVTSARRYRSDGYFKRVGRNLTCMTLYALRVPPRAIARIYQ